MTTEDLGDPRLYEDEAIREQAAALQIHFETLINRITEHGPISKETKFRIWRLRMTAIQADETAYKINRGL